MLSELHHSHQSFIFNYPICDCSALNTYYCYQCSKTTIYHMPRDVLLLHVPVSTKLPHGFKGMIPRVTQLPVLPKLPHKTRPHATNEPPKTSTNRLLSPLPTRLVWTHTTVCRPASILHMEQSAESVEAVEDWMISPSVSRYLRDASHWPCLHSQPQVGMLTIYVYN